MTGQEVAERDDRTPAQKVTSQVRSEQFLEQVKAALPGNVKPERFVRATITALLQNPKLADVEDIDSLFNSALKAASDGLLPDGREAAFVDYGGKVQYLPMIGGFRKIAAEHGWSIITDVVYENDEFEYELGLEPSLVHRPAPLRTDRGQKVYAYAIGRHGDGRREFEVMGAEEIEKIRQVSRAKDRGPWKDWPERMWEKTVGRRLFAKLPLDKSDDRIARMLEASKENAADLLYGPDGTAHPVTPALERGDATTDAAPDVGGAAAERDEPEAPGDGTSGQQAAAETKPVPAAAPGTEQDDDPEPVAPQQTTFEIPEGAIDEAAAAVIPRGDESVKGKTLAEQAATELGDAWLRWALRRATNYWLGDFRGSLELFVEHRAPEIWAEYVEERDAA